MENTTKAEKSKDSKTPLLVNIAILAGVLSVLLQTFIRGSGTIVGYIFQALGSTAMTAFIALIIGFIPYLFLKRYIKKAKLIVFSISFLLTSIITLLGIIYREI